MNWCAVKSMGRKVVVAFLCAIGVSVATHIMAKIIFGNPKPEEYVPSFFALVGVAAFILFVCIIVSLLIDWYKSEVRACEAAAKKAKRRKGA